MIVSASVVRTLKSVPDEELPKDARKLLTFVDNREDASLQAGYFNDFVQVTQIRGALFRALADARGEGLRYEELARHVAAKLGLQAEEYAASPGEMFGKRDRTAKALREVIEYRLFVDLQRGRRVTMPNLEQTGLLTVGYADLAAIAGYEPAWDSAVPQLKEAAPALRAELARITLDELRKALAIDVSCLTQEGFDSLQPMSRRLNDAWALPDNEQLPPFSAHGVEDRRRVRGRRLISSAGHGLPNQPWRSGHVIFNPQSEVRITGPAQVGTGYAGGAGRGGSRADVFLSGRGRLGRHLRDDTCELTASPLLG